MNNTTKAYYFPHDSNARNDIKIMKLRRKHGMAGYGVFWAIIEILRETSDYRLSTQDMEDIAFQLSVDTELVLSVVNDFGLFTLETASFYSPRLMRNMESFSAKRKAQSAGGKKSQEKRKTKPSQEEPFT